VVVNGGGEDKGGKQSVLMEESPSKHLLSVLPLLKVGLFRGMYAAGLFVDITTATGWGDDRPDDTAGVSLFKL
jgi:hypothetical protein